MYHDTNLKNRIREKEDRERDAVLRVRDVEVVFKVVELAAIESRVELVGVNQRKMYRKERPRTYLRITNISPIEETQEV